MNVDNLGHPTAHPAGVAALPNMQTNRYLIEMAVRDLDPLTTWNIVSEKVLSQFKIWDLLVHKVFRYAHQQITEEGLQHLAGEVDLLIKELKQFLVVRCDNKTRQSFLTSGYLDQNLARLISTGTFPPPSVPPERSAVQAAAAAAAAAAQVPPATTDFRNMPYHYEAASNEAAAAAAIAAHRDSNVAMLALANVKTEYGGGGGGGGGGVSGGVTNKHDFHQHHAVAAAAQYQHNFYNSQVPVSAPSVTSPPPTGLSGGGTHQGAPPIVNPHNPQHSHHLNNTHSAAVVAAAAPTPAPTPVTSLPPPTTNVGKIDRCIQLSPSELEGPLTQEETDYETMAKKRKRLKNRKGPIFYPPCKSCIQCKNCKKRAKIKLRLEWADHFPVTKEQYQQAIKGGSPFQCAKCHMEFLTKQGFVTHLNSKCTQMILPKPTWKKLNGRYLCDFQGCPSGPQGKSWCTTTGVWAHHYAEHENFTNLPYVCDSCPKSFPTKTLLSNHRQEKHTALKKQHPCRFCGKMFTTRSILRVHERGHTGEKPFPCDLCDFRATSVKRVTAHKKRQHENRPKNEVCEICGKGFLLRYQLKEHLNTHADVKTHPCQLCGKVLKNFNSHRRHMIRSHGVGFTCEICGGNDFGTKSGLLKHKRDKHGMHI